MEDHQSDPLDRGTPGASARREHDRRRAARERRTRALHPMIGGAVLALRDAPAHEQAWETGASGEETTARHLARHCPGAIVLHDRRMPGGRGNIDHLAVAPGGVLVVDSKRYRGKRVRVRTPLLGSPKLLVDGSDRTRLVDALLAQVGAVARELETIGFAVPVRGALCFLDADLPLLGTPAIRGVELLGRRGLARRVNREGPLTPQQMRQVARHLAGGLKPA